MTIGGSLLARPPASSQTGSLYSLAMSASNFSCVHSLSGEDKKNGCTIDAGHRTTTPAFNGSSSIYRRRLTATNGSLEETKRNWSQ